MGDESLEARGEGPTELFVEECLEFWLPVVVVVVDEVAEGSGVLVLERSLSDKLDAVRPRPEGPSETADDLSMITVACKSGGVRVEGACHRDGP